jgi:hypothetical protein
MLCCVLCLCWQLLQLMLLCRQLLLQCFDLLRELLAPLLELLLLPLN